MSDRHEPIDPLPANTTIEHIELAVADRQEVLAFYTDIVGLEVIETQSTGLDLGVDETTLLKVWERPELPPRPRAAAGLFHLAIRVPSRQALADAASRLTDADMLTGASDHAVSEALYTRDPAGNGVEIYRDRPRGDWPMTDGTVQMTTDPLELETLLVERSDTWRDGVPTQSDLGHVHLEVTDLSRALEWYVPQLGFNEMARYQGGRFVAAGGYHHHLGLNVWNSRTEPATGRGLQQFTIDVQDERVIEVLRNRLESAVRKQTADQDSTLLLADPDGIKVQLTA